MQTILNLDTLLSIALSVAFGAVVGIERELAHRPAGLRTHMLVSLGACLFTIISTLFTSQPAHWQAASWRASVSSVREPSGRRKTKSKASLRLPASGRQCYWADDGRGRLPAGCGRNRVRLRDSVLEVAAPKAGHREEGLVKPNGAFGSWILPRFLGKLYLASTSRFQHQLQVTSQRRPKQNSPSSPCASLPCFS